MKQFENKNCPTVLKKKHGWLDEIEFISSDEAIRNKEIVQPF